MYYSSVYKIFWEPKGGFERTPSNPPCLRACTSYVQHRMATPICIADSWSKPLPAVQIAELQPEWDEDDKSNELLPPDAPPTQALPDRTQYYVSKCAPTAGNAVRYRSIRAQRQAACEHEQYKRAIKNRDKLCAKRQLKLDI